MSEEDVLLAKGRLLQNYMDANGRLKTLEAEAKRTGAVVQGLADYLKSGGESGSFSTGGSIPDILSENVIALIAELQETRQRRNDLRQSLAEMGLDLGGK